MEVACRMPRQLGVAQVQVQVQVQAQAQAQARARAQAQACVGIAALPAATLFMRHGAATMTCLAMRDHLNPTRQHALAVHCETCRNTCSRCTFK